VLVTVNERILIAVSVGLVLAGCGSGEGASTAAPDHVENAVPESQLTTISLSDAAVRRLGIQTARVERRVVKMTRMFGGELLVPPGRVMTVGAPTAGIALGPRRGDMLRAGATVQAGDVVMELLPLPPDSDALGASEEVAVRESELSVARARAERARQLLTGRSGSQEQVEQAEAELVRAEAAARLARSQQSLLLGADARGLTPITLVSQQAGVLAELHAASGQLVPAGAPLFSVQAQERLWVRVPVYSSDQSATDAQAPATIASLGAPPGQPTHVAHAIVGPPSANPIAASIDLYYEIDNTDGVFRPGQRVQVDIDLRESGEHLVVPWSSVLQDIHGGSWVYVQRAPGVYVRTRVELQRIVGDIAVLARGPDTGAEVVTVGVAELAGSEFGVAH
jgi:RND family efflux transporter MFP subunit